MLILQIFTTPVFPKVYFTDDWFSSILTAFTQRKRFCCWENLGNAVLNNFVFFRALNMLVCCNSPKAGFSEQNLP